MFIYLHSHDLAIRCLNFFFLNSQSPSLLHSATMTVCGFVFFVTLSVFRIFPRLIEILSDKIIGIKLEDLEIQGHYKDFWVLTVKSEPSNS